METGKNNYPELKKALEIRAGSGLPSNFNYRMMGRIRLEAERRKKRHWLISWVALILASLLLIGFGAYMLMPYVEFDVMDYLPQIERTQSSSELAIFYWYIASLILILLGFDYWMRKRKRKAIHE